MSPRVRRGSRSLPVEEADFVIVGAGSAGCVVARRLGESSGARVLVLEAGGPYSHGLDVPLVSLWFWSRRAASLTWPHVTAPQSQLGGRRLAWPTGKLAGGSSSINAMIYLRGHPACFDRWAALGNRGWSFAECLPHFVRSERYDGPGSEFHGTSGPLGVSESRYRPASAEVFLAGCAEAGIPITPDFNGATPEGAGFYQLTQWHGRRVSAGPAFLEPVVEPGRVTLLTGATITRIEIESGRACGVEYRLGGELRRVRAAREVILAAGALHSPAILMRSGVGPAEHLESHGIRVAVDSPAVGEHLHDHPGFPVVFRSRVPRPNRLASLAAGAPEYALRRTGLFTSNLCDAGAVLRSTPGLEVPDVQIVFHWKALAPHPPDTVDLHLLVIDPKSRGSVRLRSSDPLASPVVDPGYLTDPADLRTAERGIEICRTIGRTGAFRSAGLGPEMVPGEGSSREALHESMRCGLTTGYHPAGTCRMGPNPAESVVDDRLRVHGITGLRVADSSIMPEVVSANTNAAALMIGEKCAVFVLGRA